MKSFLAQLFSDSGRISMMRVMSILSLLAGIATAFVGLNKTPIDYSGISLLVSVFLSAAFGGKVMQKRIEINGVKADTEVDTPPRKDPEVPTKPKVDNPD
jgi:uncharacterized membrane protein YiaA